MPRRCGLVSLALGLGGRCILGVGVGGGLRASRGFGVGVRGEAARGMGILDETGETGGGEAKGSRSVVKSSEIMTPEDGRTRGGWYWTGDGVLVGVDNSAENLATRTRGCRGGGRGAEKRAGASQSGDCDKKVQTHCRKASGFRRPIER